jgi:signal transduction histidine kinase
VALSELKAGFVANVSHELKTPLSLIRLFAETLLHRRVSDPKRVQEYYGTIVRETERLTHLIDNILDFSRLTSGRKRYEFTWCDLAEVVRETFESYRLQLKHGGFEHDLQVSDDLPTVRCDPAAVAQAVLNLINNAVKYSDGQRYVGVAVRRASLRARPAVAIDVSDRGIGIPPEERERLFEAFYRGQSAAKSGQRGTGLGLTLVKDIVDAHGGAIRVQSTPGKGSTFQIILPAQDSESADSGGPQEAQ